MPTPERRLKVALVCTAPRSAPGSMQAYTQTLEHALAKFAPDIDAHVVRIGPNGDEGNWARRSQTLLMLARAWAQRGFAPDVWHVLDGSRAYLASALSGAPVVITAHDLIPWLQSKGRFKGAPKTGAAARWLWRWNGAAMRGSAVLVCDSESTRRDARECFAVDNELCRVVSLPLRSTLVPHATEPSSTLREPGHVLHVGNNSFYKARPQALRIFARLAADHARKLSMAGPQPTTELKALAASLGIADRIEWLGDPDDATLAGLYRCASVLLFPSCYEGFGWPVLEAMAFGLPVVSSNRGSLPEVAGDACQCLDPDDIDAFAAAATRLLVDSDYARTASEVGRRWAAEFSGQQFAAAMRNAYWAAARKGKVT